MIPRWGLLTCSLMLTLISCSAPSGYLRVVDIHPDDPHEARMVDFVGARFTFVCSSTLDLDLLLRVDRSLQDSFPLEIVTTASDGRYFGDTLVVDPLRADWQVVSNRTNPLRELEIPYLREARVVSDTVRISIRALQMSDRIKNIGLESAQARGI